MKFKLTLVLAALIAAAPAYAETHMTSGHASTQTYHDRSPRIHDRGAQPHHQA